MTKIDENIQTAQNILSWIIERCYELEKENKNLKLIQETNEEQIQNDIKERDELRKENKRLKEENEELKKYKSMYEWLCK